MNTLYFKILQGIAFGSSLYRFPWLGAAFKTKERKHEEFFISPLACLSYDCVYIYVITVYSSLLSCIQIIPLFKTSC